MAKTTLNQADFSGLYGEDEVPVTFVSNQVTTTDRGRAYRYAQRK